MQKQLPEILIERLYTFGGVATGSINLCEMKYIIYANEQEIVAGIISKRGFCPKWTAIEASIGRLIFAVATLLVTSVVAVLILKDYIIT